MNVRMKPLKRRLSEGGTCLVSFGRLPEPGLAEILGYAGFDGIIDVNSYRAHVDVAKCVHGGATLETRPENTPETLELVEDVYRLAGASCPGARRPSQ